MIESGSLTPGVDAADFLLPAGTAIRIERPAAAVRPFVASYAVLDSDLAVWKGPDSWLLPGSAKLWIALTDGPIRVGVRNRDAPLGSATLLGDTSRAMPVSSRGGISIVLDLTPVGWARLCDASALDLRDQVTPLDAVLPGWSDELIEALHACDRAAEVKGVLDAFLLSRLPSPQPDEAAVARIAALFVVEPWLDTRAASDRVGLTSRALLRLCNRHFGFGPKLLMRRARFLQVLAAMLISPEPPDFSAPPPGYHDVPHFLRDGNLFLGMTPRRFLAMPMPYLRAALRARALVCGAPLALLDRYDDAREATRA